jgi:hypothetical protein
MTVWYSIVRSEAAPQANLQIIPKAERVGELHQRQPLPIDKAREWVLQRQPFQLTGLMRIEGLRQR